MKNKKILFFFLISGFMFVFAAMLSAEAGEINISPGDIIDIIKGRGSTAKENILLYSRLPRTAGCLGAGTALAVSGAVLQAITDNKLASPGIIGVNAGAGAGVTVCCALGLYAGIYVSLFAFAGSITAALIIALFAGKTNASRTTVILGGVALNGILGALSEAVASLDRDAAALSAEFRAGGFSDVSYQRLIPSLVMIMISLLVIFSLLNELDAIALGDETAKSIGLDVKKYRIIFLIFSALLAGSAVSFSGLLGFIGLIIPHFVRRFTGSRSSYLLPGCAVAGGAFVCLSDTLTRLIFMPYEIPVGIIMALAGGPVFIFLLLKMKGGHRNASV